MRRGLLRRMPAVAGVALATATVAGGAGPAATVARWQAAAPIPVAVSGAGFAPLLGGTKALVVGGSHDSGGALSSLAAAQVYDPATNAWKKTSKTVHPLGPGTMAIPLRDGRVLAIGIRDDLGQGIDAEVYDPKKDRWSPTDLLTALTRGYAAALLADGRVLFASGRATASSAGNGTAWSYPRSAYLFDPATSHWSPAADAPPLAYASATGLADGRLLLTGGCGNTAYTPNDPCPYPVATAWLFDPVTNAWKATSHMVGTHKGQETVLLQDKRVLAVTEVFDPAKATWSRVAGAPNDAGAFMTMPTGKVLAVGDDHAYLFDPQAGSWSPTASLPARRQRVRLALLANGKVLATSALAAADLYTAPGPVLKNVNAIVTPAGTALVVRFSVSEPATVAATSVLGVARVSARMGPGRLVVGLSPRVVPGRYAVVVSATGRTGSDSAPSRLSVDVPRHT